MVDALFFVWVVVDLGELVVDVDVVVNGVVGFVGLLVILVMLLVGKRLVLVNKESLIVVGLVV